VSADVQGRLRGEKGESIDKKRAKPFGRERNGEKNRIKKSEGRTPKKITKSRAPQRSL